MASSRVGGGGGGFHQSCISALRPGITRVAREDSVLNAIRATTTLIRQSLVLLKLALFCHPQRSNRFFDDRWSFMEYAIKQVGLEGDWCEFGVFRGESLRFIASHTTANVYAFDTFEGLPSYWAGMKPGTFTTGGRLPDVPPNAVLEIGRFEVTVPAYVVSKTPGPVAFAHIDSDLYESAATALRNIGPSLAPGSILVFDELLSAFNNDEYSALVDELLTKRLRFRWVGFYLYPQGCLAACLRVLSRLDTRNGDKASRPTLSS
jgi:hypothetical protein